MCLPKVTQLVIDGVTIWLNWDYVKNLSGLLDKIEMSTESEEQKVSRGCPCLSLTAEEKAKKCSSMG